MREMGLATASMTMNAMGLATTSLSNLIINGMVLSTTSTYDFVMHGVGLATTFVSNIVQRMAHTPPKHTQNHQTSPTRPQHHTTKQTNARIQHHPNAQNATREPPTRSVAPSQHARNNAVSEVMWPLTAPCWVPLGSGEHVVGQWCSWIMMRRWGRCMECVARWRQN